MSKNRKDHPYFAGFMKWQQEQSVPEVASTAIGGAALGLGVITVGLGLAFLRIPIASVPILIAAAALLGFSLSKFLRKPKLSPTELERREKISRAIAQFTNLSRERKLHKSMDPAILQLLEAASFHWTRLKSLLDSPSWTGASVGDHWKTIRAQSWQAANHAMEELVLMSTSCIGEPQGDKQRAVKEIMGDFRDLDFMDALQGLSRIANSDWSDYSYRSPNAPLLFEPGRLLAEKIKTLADEIERTTSSVNPEAQVYSTQNAADSLDGILSEIRAVREAETELQQQNFS